MLLRTKSPNKKKFRGSTTVHWKIKEQPDREPEKIQKKEACNSKYNTSSPEEPSPQKKNWTGSSLSRNRRGVQVGNVSIKN